MWRSSGHVETNAALVTGAVWTLEDEQIILEPTSLSTAASLDTTLTTGTPLLYHTTPPKMVSRLSETDHNHDHRGDDSRLSGDIPQPRPQWRPQ